MSDPAEPEGSSHYTESIIPLVRTTATRYVRDFRILLGIAAVRLVPFYVLLWLFPVADRTVRVLVETLIAVPCIAALVRFAWTGLSGIEISASDAILGSAPVETLKLLATHLLIIMMTLFLTAGGPALFLILAFGLSWVTLVADQVVVIEGQMLYAAIRRSLDLVRTAWQLSLAVLAIVSVPDIASIVLSMTMEPTVVREVALRVIVLLTLPFTVVCVTLLYHQHLVPADAV